MKRFLILLLAGGLCAFSAGAQQTAQLLDAEGLKAANDSVLLEGCQLYWAERVAWEMEDAFHYCKTKSVDMYGGWFPVTEDGVNVKGIFFDEAKEHVVFEALMNIRTGELSSNDAVRDLTPAEIERIDKRRRMFEAVQTLDDLPRRPAGDDYMFNADIVQVDEDLFRVYFMLGTAKNGVTPFGCDFSYDCDSEGNVKAFRRYHKTTLLLPTTFDDGSPAVKTAHPDGADRHCDLPSVRGSGRHEGIGRLQHRVQKMVCLRRGEVRNPCGRPISMIELHGSSAAE